MVAKTISRVRFPKLGGRCQRPPSPLSRSRERGQGWGPRAGNASPPTPLRPAERSQGVRFDDLRLDQNPLYGTAPPSAYQPEN